MLIDPTIDFVFLNGKFTLRGTEAKIMETFLQNQLHMNLNKNPNIMVPKR